MSTITKSKYIWLGANCYIQNSLGNHLMATPVVSGKTLPEGKYESLLFELPDVSTMEGEAGVNIFVYERMRNFGSQCRTFFWKEALWEAANGLLRLVNRITLRFKAAGFNIEAENDVFNVVGVGSRRGTIRTIRVEGTQTFPELISFQLTPPAPVTAVP